MPAPAAVEPIKAGVTIGASTTTPDRGVIDLREPQPAGAITVGTGLGLGLHGLTTDRPDRTASLGAG